MENKAPQPGREQWEKAVAEFVERYNQEIIQNIVKIIINYIKPKNRLDIEPARILAWAIEMQMGGDARAIAVKQLKALEKKPLQAPKS